MRSCEDFELLMNLCLDDMLPSQEQESLREHLEACPACRERFAQLREMKAALADMEVPGPAELHEWIMGYVAENTTQIPDETNAPAKVLRPRRWYRGLATVAACAVIAVAAAQFVPNVQHKSAESLATAPQAPGVSFDSAGIESESATNNKMEFFDSTEVPAAPPMSMAQPEAGEIPSTPAEPSLNMQPTGQLAEDLPPLRQETAGDTTVKDTSILKWLKAQGPKDKLPQFVDAAFVYETELDGETVTYVEIAASAEDYWTDQLSACGFSVEEMEGQDLSSDGEYILLFFFWTE